MIANTTRQTNASPPITPPTIAPVFGGAGADAGESGCEGDRVGIDDAMDLDWRLEVGREGIHDGVEDAVVADRAGREEAAASVDEEVRGTDVGAASKLSVRSAGAQAKAGAMSVKRDKAARQLHRPTRMAAVHPANRPESTQGNDTYQPSHPQSALIELKQPNQTLLEAAPPYIAAIVTPNDTTFPRLDCPPPDGDRYDYLRGGEEEDQELDRHGIEATLKYFFALDLHQCVALLPRLLGSIVEAIEFLGPKNCALSVVEGRSDDGTFETLLLLREEMDRIGVKYFFQTNEIDPHKSGDRIKALAELRNQALQPLVGLHLGTNTDVTVVLLNDVAICREDILELIHQRRRQNADMT
ncbi:MAG: hypothetical protein Q9183_004589, partial [Haloplaca sp. 2 TL-2023]